MFNNFKSASALLASSATILMLAQPALAVEAQDFVDRVVAVGKYAGYSFDFGPASANGDVITVEGVTISVPDADPFKFEDTITFSGVSEGDDGSYSAELVSVPDIEVANGSKKNPSTVSVSDLKIEGLWLPTTDNLSAETTAQVLDVMSVGPVVVVNKGNTVFSLDGASVVYDFSYEGDALSAIDSDFSISNVKLDMTSLKEEDPSSAALIEGLGLTTIAGNVKQLSSWTMADGRIVVDEFSIDFADIGRLNTTVDISGFTLPLVEKLYEVMNETGLDPNSEEAQAKAMVTFLELGQSLSLSGLTVRYDDKGIATRALDVFAQQSGVTREQFANSLKPMVRMSLGQAGIPALTDLVAPAVETFLDDPKSIELKVAPPSKTSLLVLAAGAANPAGLIKALGIAVTANQ